MSPSVCIKLIAFWSKFCLQFSFYLIFMRPDSLLKVYVAVNNRTILNSGMQRGFCSYLLQIHKQHTSITLYISNPQARIAQSTQRLPTG